jgi:hypothetical protein
VQVMICSGAALYIGTFLSVFISDISGFSILV